MKSTGSVTQVAKKVWVPEHRVLPLTAAFEGGYLDENPEITYRTVFAPSLVIKLVGPHLGMGKAALEFVIEHADTKSIAFTGYERQSDSAIFQATIGRASVNLQVAETMAAAVADEIYNGACRNYYAPYGERIRLRAQAAWIVETVSDLIETLVTAHGSAGFAESAILQRIWRDQAAASRHGHTLSASGFEALGKMIFEREAEARKMFPVV